MNHIEKNSHVISLKGEHYWVNSYNDSFIELMRHGSVISVSYADFSKKYVPFDGKTTNSVCIHYVDEKRGIKEVQKASVGKLLRLPQQLVCQDKNFVGWFNAEGTRKWDFNAFIIPARDVYLFAHWKEEETVTESSNEPQQVYKITLIDELGKYKRSTIAFEDDLIDKPPQLNVQGRKIIGWFDIETGCKWDFNKDRMPARDVTLHAKREKMVATNATPEPRSNKPSKGVDVPAQNTIKADNDIYRVFLVDRKNSTEDEIRVQKGKPIVEPEKPSYPGHIFKGWRDIKTGTFWDFNEWTMPKRDLELRAEWTVRTDSNTLKTTIEEVSIVKRCDNCYKYKQDCGAMGLCSEYEPAYTIDPHELELWPKEMSGPYGTLHKDRK